MVIKFFIWIYKRWLVYINNTKNLATAFSDIKFFLSRLYPEGNLNVFIMRYIFNRFILQIKVLKICLITHCILTN